MRLPPALQRCRAAAWAASLVLSLSPVQAATFALGRVDGPASFSFDTVGHADPFEDAFTFTVAADTSLGFSAFFNTPYSNRFWIDDLDGRLERDGVTVSEADAATTYLPPFPRREVTFAPQTLGAGQYTLRLLGTPSAVFPGTNSSYDGMLTFSSVAAPVPEPMAPMLLALGLVAVGVGMRRNG